MDVSATILAKVISNLLTILPKLSVPCMEMEPYFTCFFSQTTSKFRAILNSANSVVHNTNSNKYVTTTTTQLDHNRLLQIKPNPDNNYTYT